MKKIISDFICSSDYAAYKRRGDICYVAAVKRVFDYLFEHTYTDSEVYFLINGLGIKYIHKVDFLGYDFEDLRNNYFSEILDIQLEKNQDLILSEMEQSITNNVPVICFLRSAFLRYHKVFIESSRNEAHAIIIVGIDVGNNEVLFIDNHIKVGYEQFESYIGKMSINEFMEAWICSWKFKRKELEIGNKKELIHNNLRRFVENSKVGTIEYGLSALKNYFLYNKNIEENLFNIRCEQINFDIIINGPCHLSNYLDKLTLDYGISNKTGEGYDFYNRWNNIANMFLISAYQKNKYRFNNAIEKSFCTLNDMERYIKVIMNNLQGDKS